MRKLVLLLVFSFCFALAGCGKTYYEPSSETYTSIEHVSLIDTTDFETLAQYSSNIIEATLMTATDFSEGIIQYTFAVDTDYTNNTPAEIYMYDPYNPAYVEGHNYFLFMQGSENALYPHTIYSTVNKELILDCTDNLKCGELYYNTKDVSIFDIPAAVQEAISNGSVGKALPTRENSEHLTVNSVETAFDKADAIVKVRFSSEESANPYVSVYRIAESETIKGPVEPVSSYICLEPNLNLDTDYCLFLKEDPIAPGTYLPLGNGNSIILSSCGDLES